MCRGETSLDINWQGCHIKVSEVDLPICPNPIISKLVTERSCRLCLTEAQTGGDPEDIHPEPFNHPGFSDTKPVIDVPRVEYPEPTAYETNPHFENLAGTADELPSYVKTMSETPLPPSYELTELRDADYDGLFIPIIGWIVCWNMLDMMLVSIMALMRLVETVESCLFASGRREDDMVCILIYVSCQFLLPSIQNRLATNFLL